MNISPEIIEKLVTSARQARNPAWSQISQYPVGAAILADDGTIIPGCNIETAHGRLVCCAERVALFSAIAQGKQDFKAIALATPDGQGPCGTCRQVLLEICGNIPVFIIKDGSYDQFDLAGLLPHAFSRR